ncbi:MAG: hypothetical protein FWF10_08040 [Clostridiales bacterium]|nr:hypothetical protein [Clostridiales bacterium]
MQQNMRPAQLWRPKLRQGAYCETITEYEPIADIEIAIGVKTSAPGAINNVQTQNSTHTGVTAHADIRNQDLIVQDEQEYTVDAVAHFRRTVLALTSQTALTRPMPEEDGEDL